MNLDNFHGKYCRPHTNSVLRWLELFKLSGIIIYEVEEDLRNDEMTIAEFMEYCERKGGAKLERWVCKCGKPAELHECVDGIHRYYCWDCKHGGDYAKKDGKEIKSRSDKKRSDRGKA